jgi:hypothetical protein
MSTVPGRYRDGKVVLDTPVDWADGIPVQVSPKSKKIGMTEDEWPATPEGIRQLQKTWSFEPVELTPEEEAEWIAAREAVKKYTIEKMGQQENPFE